MAAELLTEPELDAQRQTLDRALLAALAARAEAGTAGPDAEAIELRCLNADPSRLPLLRALLGRLDAGKRPAVAVHGAEAALFAADRYGLNFRLSDSPESALGAVAGPARALIEISAKPWWGRLLARPDLRVVAAFPDSIGSRPRALLLAAEPTGPTGEDRTFWVTDSPLPDARIASELSAVGLAAELLAAGGGLKLFSLAGYVQPDDPRLADAPGALTGVIGAAPQF